MFFTRSPLIVRFRLSRRSVTMSLATTTKCTKKRGYAERDLRSGNLEIWDGAVVNSQTTFLPEKYFGFLHFDIHKGRSMWGKTN